MPYPVAAVRGKNFGSQLLYKDKMAGIESANLIAYWMLDEASGTTADNYEGTAARDGTYSSAVNGWPVGTGIGDGNTAPTFDGTNDYVDAYSVSFRDAFNGAEGTIAFWAKVSAAGVWEDGTARRFFHFKGGAQDYLRITKSNSNNVIEWNYESGDAKKTVLKTSISETGWMHIAMTWSKTGDAMKAYYGGSQEGSTQSSLGTWAGTLGADTIVGAGTDDPNNPTSGLIAHFGVWTTPLGASDIASLATV